MEILTVLTRDGCPKAPVMVNNLNQALSALGWPRTYDVVNAGKLPPHDRRAGYASPTVLYRERDLFGLPVPTQAHTGPC
jgi:hypothetical protein